MGETMVDDIKRQFEQALQTTRSRRSYFTSIHPAASNSLRCDLPSRGGSARPEAVVVYMGSLAASGGYYIACGGSHIIANETTLTAPSVSSCRRRTTRGCWIRWRRGNHPQERQIQGPPQRFAPLTEEELAYVQSLVMQTYDKFVGIVARERKQDETALRNGVADGRSSRARMRWRTS
jgi:protease-4